MIEGQNRLNLTAITEPAAIRKVHFLDSMAGLKAYPEMIHVQSAADVGSGAGFPLLPLALVTPHCRWTAIESIAKKARFIEETARALEMRNVEVLAWRAEDAGRSAARESFDVVTARAVGPVAALCEVCLPLLKTGGLLLLFKTEAALAELSLLQQTIELLGGEILPPFIYRLKGDKQDRVIVRLQKIRPTPEKYPRSPGVPFKKPLSQ